MDGSLPGTWLMGGLAERQAELDRRIANERARPAPDDFVLRRLARERMLARDRMAALAGSAMPRWARAAAD